MEKDDKLGLATVEKDDAMCGTVLIVFVWRPISLIVWYLCDVQLVLIDLLCLFLCKEKLWAAQRGRQYQNYPYIYP